jgi:uncharacterized coiled-coil protein SlyX
MTRLGVSLTIACAAVVVATTANAQTVDELKRELVARKAYISKLEKRLRDLERRSAPETSAPVVAAPPPLSAPPPRVVAASPPEDDEMDRALRAMLMIGSLGRTRLKRLLGGTSNLSASTSGSE